MDASATTRCSLTLVLVLARLVLGSVETSGQNASTQGMSQASRRITASEWEVLWTVGGTMEDTLLLGPVDVVAGEEHVYVVDFIAHRVTAFDRSSGALAWIAGREGSGPGELRNPRAAALAPNGDLLVVDFGNGRLVRFSPDGAPVSTTPVSLVLSSICALGDDSVLGVGSPGPPLARISRDGAVQARHPLPWQDGGQASGLPPVRTAAVPFGDGCVVADEDGRGFGVFGNGRLSGPYPYVERGPAPEAQVEVQRDDATQRVRRRGAPHPES